jgi:hypothetical protein
MGSTNSFLVSHSMGTLKQNTDRIGRRLDMASLRYHNLRPATGDRRPYHHGAVSHTLFRQTLGQSHSGPDQERSTTRPGRHPVVAIEPNGIQKTKRAQRAG